MMDDDDTPRPQSKRGAVIELMAALGFPLERLAVAGKCSAQLGAPAQRTLTGTRDDMGCRLQAFWRVRGEPFCRRHASSEVFSFLTGDEGAN